MDCIAHGVAKSRTQLSDFHFTSLHQFIIKDAIHRRRCIEYCKGCMELPVQVAPLSQPRNAFVSLEVLGTP